MSDLCDFLDWDTEFFGYRIARVQVNGLMALTPIPWEQRIWALPFLTVLAASKCYYHQQRGRKPKKLTDWARQMVFQLRRWLPQARLVVVGDSTYAALEFLHACQTVTVTVIIRLGLDAALYEPAPPNKGKGRPRKKGKRLPTPRQIVDDPHTHWTRMTLPWHGQSERDLDITTFTAVWFHYGLPAVPIRAVLIRDVAGKFGPQALLSTNLRLTPEQILACFLRRWQMEPTFHNTFARIWASKPSRNGHKAIARTTPILLGLFSFITLLAHTLITHDGAAVRSAAWYPKSLLTFSDPLAHVSHHV